PEWRKDVMGDLIPDSGIRTFFHSPPGLLPADLYVYQRRSTCLELNGTHRFLEQYTYNRELFVQFDSAAGVFVAKSELGRITARNWNIQREFLYLRRSAVDSVCKHNFDLDEGFTLKRRVQPQVHVSPSKKGHPQHHNLLVCHVSDFYPGHIQVRWFLNGQEETAGVLSTNLMHNGDWTFQILVMLEMTPQQGDVYTCQVEHPSLDSPVTVEWSELLPDDPPGPRLGGPLFLSCVTAQRYPVILSNPTGLSLGWEQGRSGNPHTHLSCPGRGAGGASKESLCVKKQTNRQTNKQNRKAVTFMTGPQTWKCLSLQPPFSPLSLDLMPDLKPAFPPVEARTLRPQTSECFPHLLLLHSGSALGLIPFLFPPWQIRSGS
uniref:Ig-like domain-containing protein n=1 Tax=Neovison vison TaxID=452646 RepID=A0A8C7AMT7_NEOVI